jgi:serine/threonine protein phosphatase PrpC
MGLAHPVKAKVQEKYGNEYVRVGTCSMQGRREEMEDEHSVVLSLAPCHPKKALFAVFDGHCGKMASQYCAQHLRYKLANSQTALNDQDLINIVHELDAEFMTNCPEFRGHGSTLVFAIVDFANAKQGGGEGDELPTYKATFVNVGDSRVLWGTLRDTDTWWNQCTEDHNPSNPVETERIKKAGGFVSMDSRVDGNLALSRAIGDHPYKSNEKLGAYEQKVIPTPDITHMELRPRDWLLVACDGIFEGTPSHMIADTVMKWFEMTDCPIDVSQFLCDYVVDARGSGDNTTVVAILFEEGLSWLEEEGHIENRWFVEGPLIANSERQMRAYAKFAIDNGFPENAPNLSAEGEDD